jgi:aconitate hydratase
VKVVIVKSFARIHETNLKKQGALAFTFVNNDDYAKVRQDDKVTVVDFNDFAPGKNVSIRLDHADGTSHTFEVAHTYNQAQIDWVTAGSALNKIRADFAAA